MSVLSDAALTTEAEVIKNETTDGANTADRVGQMMEDLIDSKVNVAFRKSFSGIINQASTGAPTVTAGSTSTFTSSIIFTRGSSGVFNIASSAEFTAGKTLVFFNNGVFGGGYVIGSRQNSSLITFSSISFAGSAADDLIETCSVQILVYP